MNTKDRKSLFCSEVIQWAFQDLAGGKEDFPRFPTSFRNFQHHPFLQEMGVKVSETFAPADIELDPNFQVVMEFRRVQELRTTRMLDSVAESIYDFMKSQHYKFQKKALIQSAAEVARSVLRPLGFFKENFPPYMSRAGIVTVANFYQSVH